MRVDVIWPKSVDVIEFAGCAKFWWLNKLNASARNCTETRSRIAVTFAIEKSMSWNPGAVRMLRPALPKPVACRESAAVLNHRFGEGCGRFAEFPNKTLGRLEESRLASMSAAAIIELKGLPDCKLTI